MAKYIIEESTLKGLGDALRKVTGQNRTYTPTEMIEAVTTIMDAATYILVDEDGNEVPAVFVDNVTEIDATANDIRLGTTAVTAEGITEGAKEIPSYQTTEGYRIVTAGSPITIPMYSDKCQYTKLQVIICLFNTDLNDSVAARLVVINDRVYEVNSTIELSEVTIDDDAQTIDLGLVNDGDGDLMIRYMSIKEDS